MEKIPPIKELRKICRPIEVIKKTRWDVRYFCYPSIYITRILLRTKITANQITIFSSLIQLLGILLLIGNNYIFNILFILSSFLWMLFDSVDGEIARYRRKTSSTGFFLDEFFYRFNFFIFFIAIGLGAYFRFGNVIYIFLGFITSSFCLLENFVKIKKYEALTKDSICFKRTVTNESEINNFLWKIKDFIFNFFKFRTFGFTFFAALFNIMNILLIIYSILYPLMFLLAFYKTYKELKNYGYNKKTEYHNDI